VPFKAKAACRHHIPKQRHRVTNWAEYDAALRQRGSLTVWFTDAAIAAWRAAPRTTPGGQPSYSDLAIATALTLRAVFRLALRQTEGLIGSIIHLLGLELAVPDHSTLSRRAEILELPRSTETPAILRISTCCRQALGIFGGVPPDRLCGRPLQGRAAPQPSDNLFQYHAEIKQP
jgi:Transposase DDE domain